MARASEAKKIEAFLADKEKNGELSRFESAYEDFLDAMEERDYDTAIAIAREKLGVTNNDISAMGVGEAAAQGAELMAEGGYSEQNANPSHTYDTPASEIKNSKS